MPKLLDFGIAKVVSDDTAETIGVRTKTGSFWLTPDYASPEQVKGDNVTTSSDVYGLGVVLFELLTGQRPFVVPHTDPLELRRMITEVAPDRPSVVAARIAASTDADVVAERDPIVTDRHARRLRGDLDVIILKALRKEPERRYFSTEAMASDIRRYLDGRPLRARADSVNYRVSKYLRRNAKMVISGLALLALAFGSIGFHTSRITKQRNIAQSEAEKSEQVATFMSGLLGAFGPNQSARGTVQVDEILKEGVESIESDPTIHPEVQAQVYVNIGDLYEDYAEYDKATDVLVRARKLQDQVYEPVHPAVTSTMALLGWTMYKNGAGRPAVDLLEDALERQRKAPVPDQALIAVTLNMLGVVYMEGDELALALSTFEEALQLQRSDDGSNPQLIQTLGNLGYIYRRLDETERAEESFREALTIAKSQYAEHSDLATALHGYGAFLVGVGQFAEGVHFLEEALAMRLKIFGEDHPQVADTRSNLGVVYQDLGRFDDALDQQVRALEINRSQFGPEHITVAHSHHLIGWLYFRLGEYDAAEPYLVESGRLYAKVYHPRHSYVAVAENKIGLIRTEQKNFVGAEDAFGKSLSIREEVYGAENDNTLITMTNLGMMFLDSGRPERAEEIIRDVLRRRENSPVPSNFRVGQAKRDLGAILTAKHQYVEAEQLLQAGFDLLRESRGLEDPYTQRSIERMIDLYTAMGNRSKLGAFKSLLVESPVASAPIR